MTTKPSGMDMQLAHQALYGEGTWEDRIGRAIAEARVMDWGARDE